MAGVQSFSSLPPYVDRHCLKRPGDAAEATREDGNVLVLHFRVGHARYYLAFPVTPDVAWHPGDAAEFVSATCEIKRVAPSGARQFG